MPDETTDVTIDEPERPSAPSRRPNRPSSRRMLVLGTLVAVILAAGAGALVAVSLSDDDPEQLGDGSGEIALDPIDEDAVIGRPIAAAYETFDGETANTASYLGRPLLLNFFAEWCPPCVAEMPAIESVHQELGDEVAFLGISTQEPSEKAQSIIGSTGITYDVGRDPDGEMFATFQGTGMPTTAVIDANGTVVAVHSGALDADELRALIDDALSTEVDG